MSKSWDTVPSAFFALSLAPELIAWALAFAGLVKPSAYDVQMSRIYVPSEGPDAWRSLLAKPELHWARGYSARSLAHCWEAADGLPAEVAAVLEPAFGPTELLFAIPEHKVALPGGRRESQCDVFALVRGKSELIACAVEGKVDEPFGPSLAEWLEEASPGKLERLRFIQGCLGLEGELDGAVRYQLLHRTAAAVVEAERFTAGAAAMVVHSFSPEDRWRDDFERFLELFSDAKRTAEGQLLLPGGKRLVLGWASGDQGFRAL